VIVARVVWRSGVRAGLQAEDRVPVEEILTIGQSPALQLIAGERPSHERRKRPRTHEQSRFRARALEFASIAVTAACLAGAAAITMEKVLARPLAMVSFALGG
jgi:hypothetical protein